MTSIDCDHLSSVTNDGMVLMEKCLKKKKKRRRRRRKKKEKNEEKKRKRRKRNDKDNTVDHPVVCTPN